MSETASPAASPEASPAEAARAELNTPVLFSDFMVIAMRLDAAQKSEEQLREELRVSVELRESSTGHLRVELAEAREAAAALQVELREKVS